MPAVPQMPERWSGPDGTHWDTPFDPAELPSEREVEEARKGERTLRASQINALRKQQELEAHKAKYEFNEEEEARRYERYKRKVAAEARADAERQATDTATVDAMSPREYAAHLERQKAAPPVPYVQMPKRFTIALDDVRRDERKAAIAEQEAAEAKAGIPKMQAASAERCQRIRDQAATELAELDQRRQAVRQRRERKLADEEERCRAEVQCAREKLQEVPA